MSQKPLSQRFTQFMRQTQKSLHLPKAVAEISLQQFVVGIGLVLLLAGSVASGYLLTVSQDIRQQAATISNPLDWNYVAGFNCSGTNCTTADRDWFTCPSGYVPVSENGQDRCQRCKDAACTQFESNTVPPTQRVDCSPSQNYAVYYCPNQTSGTCKTGLVENGTIGAGQAFNAADHMNAGCGLYQIDFNDPATSDLYSGNCGAVTYLVSSCGGSGGGGTGGGGTTATPAPTCTVNLRIPTITKNGQTVPANVKENETVWVDRGDILNFEARIFDKSQGKVSEIRFKSRENDYDRPFDFLIPSPDANQKNKICTWDGTTSLDDCANSYKVNPLVPDMIGGVDSRAKVEVVAKITGRDGQISSITCTDEVKLKVNPAPSQSPSPTPTPKVVGSFDVVNTCTSMQGWACDGTNFSQPLQIHFYADGLFNQGGKFIGSTVANVPREAAVAAKCGGVAAHGFTFAYPASLKDGKTHTIYAYAIGLTPGTNMLLVGSPKNAVCQPPTATPTVRPTSTPTPLLSCNSTCRTNAQCQAFNPNWKCEFQNNCTGIACPIGNCRLASNPSSTVCLPPTATPTPSPTNTSTPSPSPTNTPTPSPTTAPYCNIACSTNSDCNSAHICYKVGTATTGFCRLESHPSSTVCQQATATPTPSPTDTPPGNTSTPTPTVSAPALPQSGNESSTVTAVVATGIVVLIVGAIGLLLLL